MQEDVFRPKCKPCSSLKTDLESNQCSLKILAGGQWRFPNTSNVSVPNPHAVKETASRDCLYSPYRYEYIALLDIDEVIMPLMHNNWAEMMEAVVEASFKVQ